MEPNPKPTVNGIFPEAFRYFQYHPAIKKNKKTTGCFTGLAHSTAKAATALVSTYSPAFYCGSHPLVAHASTLAITSQATRLLPPSLLASAFSFSPIFSKVERSLPVVALSFLYFAACAGLQVAVI